MKVQVKKMFGGKVSVRSYLVKFCKRNHQNLVIEFEKKRMTIDYYSLGKYTTDGNEYKAKRSDQYIRQGEKYKLYDYLWTEDREEVGWTKEGLSKLMEVYKNVFNK